MQTVNYRTKADDYAKVYFAYIHHHPANALMEPPNMSACSDIYMWMLNGYTELFMNSRPYSAESFMDVCKHEDGFPKDIKGYENLKAHFRAVIREFEAINPSEEQMRDAVKKLRLLAKDHKMVVASERALQVAMADKPTEQKVLEFEKLISSVTDEQTTSASMKVGSSMNDTLDILEKEHADPSNDMIIPLGFKKLDELIGGAVVGEMTVLAGRPSQGKSTALSMACRSMARNGKRVVLFSVEMNRRTMDQFAFQHELGWTMLEQNSRKAPGCGIQQVRWLAKELDDLELYIADSSEITIEKMEIEIERIQRKKGKIDVVAVDYLQYVNFDKKLSRYEGVSEVSKGLKMMAKTRNICVLAASQLRRPSDSRAGLIKPTMSDLKESGAIEQDAAQVIAIHRESVYNPDDLIAQHQAEFLVLKNRYGRLGNIECGWNPERGCFTDNMPGYYEKMALQKRMNAAEKDDYAFEDL